MSDALSIPETILRLCAEASPSPWYPSEFAKFAGIERERFDPALNALRVAGLVEITDWVSGRGQGYLLTPAGEAALRSPKQMAQVREGRIPVSAVAPRRQTNLDERTHFGRGEAIRNALLYPEKPRVTYVLMALNILVFVAGFIIAARNNLHVRFIASGEREALHLTGSVSGADLVNGQWWRLLSSCFVHWGAIHLFMNMYSLYVVGPLVEQLWGRARYVVIYLLAGIGGSSLAMLYNPMSNLAGASGALFGLLGALVVWWVANRKYLPREMVRANLNNLLTVLIMNAILSFLPMISWTAHFAGGIAGGAVALLLHLHRFGPSLARWAFLLLVPLVPALAVGALVYNRNHAPRWGVVFVEEELKQFNREHVNRILRIDKQIGEYIDNEITVFARLDQRRPGDVRRFRDDLQELRSESQKLADELTATNYRSPRVSEASAKAIQLLKKTVELIDHVDDQLEAGAEFDNETSRSINRVTDARKEWAKLFR